MSLDPARYDFTLRQGATHTDSLTCLDADGLPVDLTGCSALMQIRTHPKAISPLLEMSTTNGRLVIDGPAGVVSRVVSDDDSAPLLAGTWLWDLFLTWPDGRTDQLFYGDVTIPARITRATP